MQHDDAPAPPLLQARPARSRLARAVWAGVGWAFFALGIAGIVLPLVPTTPFMLLALWAFSRSSARLEHWLLHHAQFGPPLRRWREHRVIPRSAKLISWGSMAASLVWMTFVTRLAWPYLLLAVVIMGYGAWFIARCPSRPPTIATPPPA